MKLVVVFKLYGLGWRCAQKAAPKEWCLGDGSGGLGRCSLGFL